MFVVGPPTNTQKLNAMITENVSRKDWTTALLLCLFLGNLGVHSFYSGNTVRAVLQLFTLGGCGIWTLIDLILIIQNKYTDGEGLFIVKT